MAKGNFEICRRLTGVSEGGWSDRPLSQDKGGPTMRGVTLKTYTAWCLSKGMPAPTKDDLRNISDDVVSAIFREQFWAPVKGEQLPVGLDYAVFDFAINSGPARAVIELQQILNVAADGIIGAMTLSAVQAAADSQALTEQLIVEYQAARLTFMKTLSTWKENPGWPTRVSNVQRQAIELLYGARPAALPGSATEAPAVASDTKLSATTEGAGAVATGVGAAGTVLSEAAKGVQPLADISPVLLWLFLGLTVAGIALTTWAVLRKNRQKA